MSSLRSTFVAVVVLALLSGCDASEPIAAPAVSTAASGTLTDLGTCDACVVGPVVLTRHAGAPSAQTWSVPARPGASYLLHLDDLGTRGANAQVLLNGTEVAWRFDETGARRHHAVIELTLLAENTLSVRLTGKPGSRLRVALEPGAPVPMATLSVIAENAGAPPTSGAFNGPANGRVTGPGIDCTLVADVAGGDCVEQYPIGTAITLTAAAGERSLFSEYFFETPGGSGDYGCMLSGGGVCQVTVTGDSTLHATFKPLPAFLYVTVVGPPGTGAWINSNEISCFLTNGVQEGDCMSRYEGGVLSLTLRVLSVQGVFVGWSGACGGTATECLLTSQPGDTLYATATFTTP